MKTNSIENKNTFKIALFSTCPIYGKLKIDKENKGYLKWYDEQGEIITSIENYNSLIVKSIINQAETICSMKYSVLWSY